MRKFERVRAVVSKLNMMPANLVGQELRKFFLSDQTLVANMMRLRIRLKPDSLGRGQNILVFPKEIPLRLSR